jgi:predicted TIM-barrel fold metal-dependent hydrolase
LHFYLGELRGKDRLDARVGAYRAALAGYSEAEQRAVLHDTASRFYRID